jgi:hypothetical protein
MNSFYWETVKKWKGDIPTKHIMLCQKLAGYPLLSISIIFVTKKW